MSDERGDQESRGLTHAEISSVVTSVAAEISIILGGLPQRVRKPTVEIAGVAAGAAVGAILGLTRQQQFSLKERSSLVANEITNLIRARVIAAPMAKHEPSPASDQTDMIDSVGLDDWAGAVAGPTELERKFGIARSTLHRWQKLNEVVSFRTGGRKYVFPLAQFIDGRPVDGLKQVLQSFGHPRLAWQWLVAPCPELDGHIPLRLLRIHQADQVVDAARQSTR
ncbi:MAG: hypothetical protein ABWZ27_07265 [Aestuariivirgaceae bacterium]